MNSEQLFREIERANFQSGGLKCLKLLRVEPSFFAKLKDESLGLAGRLNPSVVNNRDHVTKWTNPFGTAVQYSLLNISGDPEDTSSDHNLSLVGKKFHFPEECPSLAKFIAAFPHALNMRLNGMGTQSGLSPHEEHIIHWDAARRVHFLRVRFHLPLQTNSGAEILLGREMFHFEEGHIYFFNNGVVHSARNHGSEFRYHLVWDMLLTCETYRQMFSDDASAAPAFATRVASADRRLMPIGTCRLKEYETSGAGRKIYSKLMLAKAGIKPYQFQNLYNALSFRLPRRISFAVLSERGHSGHRYLADGHPLS